MNKWGAITAHSRLSEDEVTGFGFVHCSLIGTGQILLGRAWRSYARVVFASTYMEDIIDIQGWDDRGNKSADAYVSLQFIFTQILKSTRARLLDCIGMVG